MTGTTERTRTLVERFFAHLGSGDRDALTACLAEHAAFEPPRSMPFEVVSGRDQVVEFFVSGGLGDVLLPGSISLEVDRIVADGEHAVAVLSLQGTKLDGRDYENAYCWHVRCSADAIESITEHTDTLHAARELGLGGEES